MPEPQRSRTFDRAERKLDLMQELGADLMLVCSNVSPLSLGGIDRAAADFKELGERAAKRGLRVGYEALAWGRHINDHRDAWEIVRRADHPGIGLILDSFHTLARSALPHRRAAAGHGALRHFEGVNRSELPLCGERRTGRGDRSFSLQRYQARPEKPRMAQKNV